MAAWDPFRDFETLRQEIDRAFEQAGLGPLASGRVAFLPGQAARHYPLVNLHDDGQNVFVEALAPGLDPEKIEVSVLGRTVTISGEKPGPTNVRPEQIHRSERAAGRFLRTIDLPVEVNPQQARATFQNGMLKLELPKVEEARQHRLQIQTGGAQPAQSVSVGQAPEAPRGRPRGRYQPTSESG